MKFLDKLIAPGGAEREPGGRGEKKSAFTDYTSK
jgi:hypothetical protein